MKPNDILTGPDVFQTTLAIVARTGIYAFVAGRAGVTIPPLTAVAATGPPLLPRVSASQWIVDCPDANCSGAEYWWPDENLFMCCGCWNRAAGGKWLRVTPVETVQRKQVEAILRVRPDHKNRFWFSRDWHGFKAETVADLKRENREHNLQEGDK